MKKLIAVSSKAVLTASAVGILLSSSAFAQAQSQATAAAQAPAATSGLAANTRDDNRDSVAAPLAEPDQNLTQHQKQQMVIKRSFDNEAELSNAAQIEAGSTAPVDEQEAQTLEQPLVENASDTDLPESIRNMPDGSGAIAVDGKVIASTGSSIESDESSPQQDDQAQQAAEQQTSESAAYSESPVANNQPQQADARAQPSSDLSGQTSAAATGPAITKKESTARISQFETLKDAVIVNAAGEEIGYIDAVALHQQTGTVGLIVATRGLLGIRGQEVVAPIEEVTISGDSVVWNTNKAKQELRNSQRYDNGEYDRLDASGRSEGPAGISQR